ncbi:MAG: PAS domain S-box protein [Deltaproteobacteria bacterium]
MADNYTVRTKEELIQEIARLKEELLGIKSKTPHNKIAYTNDAELSSFLGYMFEIALDGMFVIDTNGRYCAVNPAGCRMFGYEPQEFFSSTIRLLLFPEDLDAAMKSLSRHDLRDGEFLAAYRMRHKDGRELLIDFTVRRFSIGKKEYLLGIKRDATDRRKAEIELERRVLERTEALKRSEERLKQAQAISNIGSWEWDIQTGGVFWTDEGYSILGYAPGEISPNYKAFISSIHPDDREAVVATISESLYQNKPYNIGFRIVKPDGAERFVYLRAAILQDENNRPRRMLGTLQDITDRKKAEESLISAQRLSSVGTLAGGIGHDFSNILLGVLGYASVAKKFTKTGEKLHDLLSEIEKSALRARSLTRQLLTFSSGGAPIREAADIAQLVEDAANLALKGSDIQKDFSFKPGLWPVHADEGQISQVINNMALNSLQAMPDGGTISISAENRTIGPLDGIPLKYGDYVAISIKDTGVGMGTDVLGKVFDPFFTTKKKASGLGLSLSYSIVKRHGGYIKAESTPGKGSCFSVYLPAAKGEAQKEENGTADNTGQKTRVLVMDDEELVRDVAGEILEMLGYDAAFAKNGEEAIEAYRNAFKEGRPFGAVILDLTVAGGMGGRDALKHLLQIDPGARAIVSSGYSKDPVMSDFRKYGFSGVVAKPYMVSEFTKVVRGVVNDKK